MPKAAAGPRLHPRPRRAATGAAAADRPDSICSGPSASSGCGGGSRASRRRHSTLHSVPSRSLVASKPFSFPRSIDLMKKVGILTGGGDAPGLNAVIRGVVTRLHHEKDQEYKCIG